MKVDRPKRQGYEPRGVAGYRGLLTKRQIAELQDVIGLQFRNLALLEEAVTHRSFLNEYRVRAGEQPLRHNELLEFVGDSVLELAATDKLYRMFPGETEGKLTQYRTALVNGTRLAETATELSLDKFLLLSSGEARDTGRARRYILACTFEAIVGAIYLDRGFGVATLFLEEVLFKKIDPIVMQRLYLNPKGHFQNLSQEQVRITPHYVLIQESGLHHNKHFKMGVYLGERLVAEGEGQSKGEAEVEAARAALEKEYSIKM